MNNAAMILILVAGFIGVFLMCPPMGMLLILLLIIHATKKEKKPFKQKDYELIKFINRKKK